MWLSNIYSLIYSNDVTKEKKKRNIFSNCGKSVQGRYTLASKTSEDSNYTNAVKKRNFLFSPPSVRRPAPTMKVDILSKRSKDKNPIKKKYQIKSVKIKFDKIKEAPSREQESSDENSMEEEELYYLIKSG